MLNEIFPLAEVSGQLSDDFIGCRHVKRHKGNKRGRFLPPEETERLGEVLRVAQSEMPSGRPQTRSTDMPIGTRYVFIASMDVDPEKEDLFNEVYDTEHVPYLLEVPGVIAVTRLKALDFERSIGGELKSVPRGETPTWHAIYEIESPDVMKSAAWAEAAERGRWPGEVRPHTRNRRHSLQRVVGA